MFTINDKPVTLEQYRRYCEIMDRKAAAERARLAAEAMVAAEKTAADDDEAFLAGLGK